MKILLIGREGQLAFELRRTLACLGHVIALDRRSKPALDLMDADSIRFAVAQIQPDLIVNGAAYTAVDRAEQESELAHRINAIAPGILAESAVEGGAGLVHYSTDYVFSGEATAPYKEDHETAPRSVYGKTKLSGEQAIQQVGPAHLILRTAWVYGRRGHNFLLTMLRLMEERERLNVVHDQVGAPTWSRLIAEASALMVARCLENGRFRPKERGGIYHLTCGGETSWYGFAVKIRKLAQAQGLLSPHSAEIKAIPSQEYPTPAKRPAYSVLSNEKLYKAFTLRLPDWEEALRLCLAEHAASPQQGSGAPLRA